MFHPKARVSAQALPPPALVADFIVRWVEMVERIWFNFLAMLRRTT